MKKVNVCLTALLLGAAIGGLPGDAVAQSKSRAQVGAVSRKTAKDAAGSALPLA